MVWLYPLQGPPAAKQTGRKRCVTSHGIRQPGPGRRTKRAISLSPPPYNYKNARAQQTKDNASRASSLQSVFGSSEACLVSGTSSLELLKVCRSSGGGVLGVYECAVFDCNVVISTLSLVFLVTFCY